MSYLYQSFDNQAADLFDNTSRRLRLFIYIIHDLYILRFIGIYQRFLSFEIYLSQNSLQRKMNKLYFKWDNE